MRDCHLRSDRLAGPQEVFVPPGDLSHLCVSVHRLPAPDQYKAAFIRVVIEGFIVDLHYFLHYFYLCTLLNPESIPPLNARPHMNLASCHVCVCMRGEYATPSFPWLMSLVAPVVCVTPSLSRGSPQVRTLPKAPCITTPGLFDVNPGYLDYLEGLVLIGLTDAMLGHFSFPATRPTRCSSFTGASRASTATCITSSTMTFTSRSVTQRPTGF